MAADLDYALALSLQDQFDRESKHQAKLHTSPHQHSSGEKNEPKNIVDTSWELTDPNPNIHNLFVQYDQMFFDGTLVRRGVAVSWSNKMTLCAGVCSYQGRSGFCSIRLSQPLLKLRPRRDLVQTLLHEMIHAYLFVTDNNTDHDGHGPNFKHHMHRINELSGTKITIYHTFHDEVNVYRQHWWKCKGPCQKRPPYFGIVMRAMNRAPSPIDPWWAEHQRSCGGTYSKIKEPEGYKKKGVKGDKTGVSGSLTKGKGHILNGKLRKIDEMFPPKDSKDKKKLVSVGGVPALNDLNECTGSSAITSLPSCGSNGSRDSIRNKMLAAAEKRLSESTNRGRMNVVDSSRKRPLSGQTPNSSGDVNKVSRNHEEKAVSNKKPKLEQSKGQDRNLTNLSKSSCLSSTQDVNQTNLDFMSTSHVIDLCEDPPKTQDSFFPKTSKDGEFSGRETSQNRETSGVEEEELIVIDDPADTEFKTCPVCGMSNIPAAIINAHVSFCLDEEESSQYIDD